MGAGLAVVIFGQLQFAFQCGAGVAKDIVVFLQSTQLHTQVAHFGLQSVDLAFQLQLGGIQPINRRACIGQFQITCLEAGLEIALGIDFAIDIALERGELGAPIGLFAL